MSDYKSIENELLAIKASLLDPRLRRAVNIPATHARLEELDRILTLEYKHYENRTAIGSAVTVGLSLADLIGVFMGLPAWAQYALAGLAILAALATGYFILTSKDPKGNLLKLIELIREIIDILGGLPVPEPVKQPVAAFMAVPASGKAPLTVKFANQSQNAEGYRWSFGDGLSDGSINPEHVFVLPGTFTVALTAYNSAGSSVATQTVIVSKDDPTPEPVSDLPPGVEIVKLGSVEIARLGGEARSKLAELKAGGNGWPGFTEAIMDSTDPNLDVLPNYPFMYWLTGYGNDGWYLSAQGYYYMKNPVYAKNQTHVIVHQKWLDGMAGIEIGRDCIPFSEVKALEKRSGHWVAIVNHDGYDQPILLAQKRDA